MDKIKIFSIGGFFMKVLPLMALLIFSFGEIFTGTAFLILGFIIVIPFSIYFLNRFGVNKNLASFVLLVFWGSVFNLFVTKNGFGGTLLFLTNVALALYCLMNIRIVKYVALLVLCYNLIFLYNKLFIEMVNPNYIYENIGLSRNHPGMLLLLWSCFWGFTKYVTERKVPIVLPILSCVLAFFLEGRSSLGILLFLSIISLCVMNRRSLFVIPILGLGLIAFYWDVVLELYMLTSFAENSLESSRFQIWRAYFEALTPISFLGGLDVSNVPLIHSYGDNPHNALLNFHYRMGLLGVMSLIALAIKSIRNYIRRSDYVLLIYMSCIIIRFMFDACINTSYDFILYAMLLYPILFKSEKHDGCYRQKDSSHNSILAKIWGLI